MYYYFYLDFLKASQIKAKILFNTYFWNKNLANYHTVSKIIWSLSNSPLVESEIGTSISCPPVYLFTLVKNVFSRRELLPVDEAQFIIAYVYGWCFSCPGYKSLDFLKVMNIFSSIFYRALLFYISHLDVQPVWGRYICLWCELGNPTSRWSMKSLLYIEKTISSPTVIRNHLFPSSKSQCT